MLWYNFNVMAQFDLDVHKPKDTLNAGQIIRIANRMLYNINNSIVIHNERTAYLALQVANAHPMNSRCSIINLVILSLFHTLGFFRHDILYGETPFSSDIQFFSDEKRIESKYMFSYYYLEFMTPLKNDSQALESFNAPFDENLKKFIYQTDYKSIIYMCARASDFIQKNPDKKLPEDINELAAIFCKDDFKSDYRILNSEIRKLGYNIPPLVNAYMSLSPTMKLFGTAINYGFGDVEETGILIAVDEILEEKRIRHVDSFIKEHPDALKITSGANKVIFKNQG